MIKKEKKIQHEQYYQNDARKNKEKFRLTKTVTMINHDK